MKDFWLIEGENSGSSGPHVAIIGAMHGNERVGVEVVERLRREFGEDNLNTSHGKNLNGRLLLMVGNPDAYAKDVRFVEEDLNRLFSEKEELAIFGGDSGGASFATPERKRAKEIMDAIRGVDVLIDIHATIRPSVPFVYCEATEKHLALASCFDVPYVVSPEPDFRPPDLFSSADNFVDRHGGIGITYESGWHKDPKSVDRIFAEVMHVLRHVGVMGATGEATDVTDFHNEFSVLPGQTPPGVSFEGKPEHIPMFLRVFSDVFARTDAFFFVNPQVANFDRVAKWEVFAMDGDEPISASRDSYVIFPKRDLVKGRIACYLAYQVDK